MYQFKTLKDILDCNNPEFIDLIENCLCFDPKKRIKPYLALLHPWITKELPPDIKVVYLNECHELKNEIENFEMNQNDQAILVYDNKFKRNGNDSADKKSVSLEKTQILSQDRNRFSHIKQKNNVEIKNFSVEKKESKILNKHIRVDKNYNKLKYLRKMTQSNQRKSITFHESTDHYLLIN